MDLLEPDVSPAPGSSGPPETHSLDAVLEAQFIIAWAGESGEGESRRMGWWKTQLGDEYAGVDLFRRLLPSTWRWAVLEAAREAARREEAQLRQRTHDPDGMLCLFGLGFDLDECLDERLEELKRSTDDPRSVFSDLQRLQEQGYRKGGLEAWLQQRPAVEVVTTPAGRRIRKSVPAKLAELVDGLLAALLPLGDEYPVPHYRRSG